ncbi:MAG TPA: sugar phosphate isomerase/epimerase family protein [bacterium]|nr:sugar phosphate isomerase/epimerase family protein [bacterium]
MTEKNRGSKAPVPGQAQLRLGLPTHPGEDPHALIEFARAQAFAFVELFIEGPVCSLARLNTRGHQRRLVRALDGFPCLGHVPPYLPLGSPFPDVRQAVVRVLLRHARFFHDIGCPAMTVHADWPSSLLPYREQISWQRDTLERTAGACRPYGVRVQYELIPTRHDAPVHCAAVVRGLTNVGFMLDVGHANLNGFKPWQYLTPRGTLARTLCHLHLHDNSGDGDNHWPIGGRRGTVNWRRTLRALKACGYQGTATLEFHSGGNAAFLRARSFLQQLWAAE